MVKFELYRNRSGIESEYVFSFALQQFFLTMKRKTAPVLSVAKNMLKTGEKR
jgi:hypothetical protein